jgi:hypothetical protein
MKITLANGIMLNPLIMRRGKTNLHGAERSTLSFVFPATEDISALDNAFSESACETFTVTGNSGSESIYKEYTVRVEIKKAMTFLPRTSAEEERRREECITVTMAQRTYMETKFAELAAKVEAIGV